MVEKGYAPFTHFVWLDGCASQFKSHKLWYFVGCYLNSIGGCTMIWSFFGIGHGKGAHDGVGAIIKWFLRQKQLNAHGVPLQNAADIVSFLCKSLFQRLETFYTGHHKPIKRIFWFIGIDDVDQNTAHPCDPILGTYKLHSICALIQYDVIKLMVRELACFCCFCVERQC